LISRQAGSRISLLLRQCFFSITFLTFLCLFAIKKINQQKHFPVNKKYFSVKKKFSLIFKKIFFLLAVFVFRKVASQTFMCLFAIKKVGQQKTLSSQRKN